jgi:DNA-binding beta-propeller fold protein YncE
MATGFKSFKTFSGICFFLGCVSSLCFSQNFKSSLDDAKIVYTGEWPANKNLTGNKKDKGNFFNLITGKKKILLKKPVSMIVDEQNTYWILDQQNNGVFEVTTKEGKISHSIEKKNYNLLSLVAICNFKKNEFLFTDSYLNCIILADTKSDKVKLLNDSLKIEHPTGIAYSSIKNEIWVSETGKHRIAILDEKGVVTKTIGMRGTGKGEFNYPTQIWIDKIGNAYVVDAMNFRIQIFDKDYKFISMFGSNGDATGFFASPKGIAVDSYGHIYVADALFHAVQIFNKEGDFLYSFGTQGQGDGQFWMPAGVFIDSKDNIYVSDSYNSRIQIFQIIQEKKR